MDKSAAGETSPFSFPERRSPAGAGLGVTFRSGL